MELPDQSWRLRRTTTLKDVARSVGVSESTVSVVLNGTRSGTRVSSNTRRSVMEAAERLGYRPNVHAQSLLTGRANRLGIYSGRSRLDARNLFFAELLGGMLEASVEERTNTLIHTSGTSAEDLFDLISSRAVDGLVVHLAEADPILEMIRDLHVPAVAVADRFDHLASICVDDVGGGMLQAHHLSRLGHRHVLYKQASVPAQSALLRMESFVDAACELGIQVTVRYDQDADHEYLTTEDVGLLTRSHNRATAAIGWSDRVAERICHCLVDLGLSVPGDVAVVGFDGFHSYFANRFDLTTIRAPWAEVGRAAVSTLMSLIRGEPIPEVKILPVEFVRGATT
jgi:DNA-binding LacI/PurR family transcriptional regulator